MNNNKLDCYKLFGELTINHRTCEDIFSQIGNIIDKISNEIQYNPENIDEYLNENSYLKDIYNKLTFLNNCIDDYKNIVKINITRLEDK